MATASPGDDNSTDLDDNSSASGQPTSTSCPVCNEVYTQPKVLPCAHRFCRKCLVTWFESCSGIPACPICKRKSIKSSNYVKLAAEINKGKKTDGKSAVTVKDIPQDGSLSAAASASGGCAVQNVGPHQKHKQTTQASAKPLSGAKESSAGDQKTFQVGKKKSRDVNSAVTVKEATQASAKPVPGAMGSKAGDQKACQVGKEKVAKEAADGDGAKSSGKASSIMSEAVVDTLPTDTVLAVLADSTRKLSCPHVCSVCCNQTHAVHLCMDCGDRLCRSCSLIHSRLSATRSHKVKQIDDLTPVELAKAVRETCRDHSGQPLELYCPSHAELVCLVCVPVRHGQCQGVQTIADAARHLRQDLQSQAQQLTDARTKLEQISSKIQQEQKELSESQVQVSKDISSLTDRITGAINARQEELMKQADKVPQPLKARQKQKKEEVDELRWMLSANEQLVSDSLQNASDASFLQVFGSLSVRMTELTSQVKLPAEATSSAPQCDCPALSVDQYDVLRIEELLRGLGSVELVERDKEKEKGAHCLPPPVTTSAEPARPEDFNPFLCRPRQTGQVKVDGNVNYKVTMCKGDSDMLFVCKGNGVCSVCASHPFTIEKLATLSQHSSVQAIVYVQGDLVMTTSEPVLLILDVTKDLKHPITSVRVSNVYTGITNGLEDTVIVCPDRDPCSLDVINKQGHTLKTFSLGHTVNSHGLCRLRDFVICKLKDRQVLLKIGLETAKAEELSYSRYCVNDKFCCMSHPLGLHVDHKDRLYLTEKCDSVIVMDLKGQGEDLTILNAGSFVVSLGGRAFSYHPCISFCCLLVYDLNYK